MPDNKNVFEDLIYCIDGMCQAYRDTNYGEAREWMRHVDTAYSNYREVVEEDYILVNNMEDDTLYGILCNGKVILTGEGRTFKECSEIRPSDYKESAIKYVKL